MWKEPDTVRVFKCCSLLIIVASYFGLWYGYLVNVYHVMSNVCEYWIDVTLWYFAGLSSSRFHIQANCLLDSLGWRNVRLAMLCPSIGYLLRFWSCIPSSFNSSLTVFPFNLWYLHYRSDWKCDFFIWMQWKDSSAHGWTIHSWWLYSGKLWQKIQRTGQSLQFKCLLLCAIYVPRSMFLQRTRKVAAITSDKFDLFSPDK